MKASLSPMTRPGGSSWHSWWVVKTSMSYRCCIEDESDDQEVAGIDRKVRRAAQWMTGGWWEYDDGESGDRVDLDWSVMAIPTVNIVECNEELNQTQYLSHFKIISCPQGRMTMSSYLGTQAQYSLYSVEYLCILYKRCYDWIGPWNFNGQIITCRIW